MSQVRGWDLGCGIHDLRTGNKTAKFGYSLLGDIYTVPKSLLSDKKGALSSDKLAKVSEGLQLLFAL